MNSIFAKLGEKTTDHVPCTNYYHRYFPGSYIDSFTFSPTTPKELCKLVNCLKNKSCVGFDDLSMTNIKKIFPIISKITSMLVSLSFDLGSFPNNLKIARVVPVLESSKEDLINYRPMSILPLFSKIF